MKRKTENMKAQIVVLEPEDDFITRLVNAINKDSGTENDWRNGLTMPMPRFYFPNEDLIGLQVEIKHCNMCEQTHPAEGYTNKEISMTGNCNCHLKGKKVTITGLKETSRSSFYRSTCYIIAESDNLIHEEEFSTDAPDEGHWMPGYIFSAPEGKYLSPAYVWMKKESPEKSYMHSLGATRVLLKIKTSTVEVPIKLIPARYNYKKQILEITGNALSWEETKAKLGEY
jgi:hypothetical protein